MYEITEDEELYSLTSEVISANDNMNEHILKFYKSNQFILDRAFIGMSENKLQYLLKVAERQNIIQKNLFRKTLAILLSKEKININPVINDIRIHFELAYSCGLRDKTIDPKSFIARYNMKNSTCTIQEAVDNSIMYMFFSYVVAGKQLGIESNTFINNIDDKYALRIENEKLMKYDNINDSDKEIILNKLKELQDIVPLNQLYFFEQESNGAEEYIDKNEIESTRLLYDMSRVDLQRTVPKITEKELSLLLYSYYIKHGRMFDESNNELIKWLYYNLQIYCLQKAYNISNYMIRDIMFGIWGDINVQ